MDEPTEVALPSWKYDTMIDALIAFGIALNIYLVVDFMMDGALTNSLVNRAKHVGHNMGVWYGVQRDKLTVLEHATDIIESNAGGQA